MQNFPSVIALGIAAYTVLLLAVAWGFDHMAKRTAARSAGWRTNNFTYHESHDAWLCPKDHWLWPTSFDPENRVMRYRANPTVCNACPVKETCTVTNHGREVTREIDPWPHSESGRFHRGVALTIACFGAVLPAAMLLSENHTMDVVVLSAAALLAIGGGIIPLARHLWNTPSGFPEAVPHHTDEQALRAVRHDRYAATYRSSTAKKG
ncbi:hypothetical protein F7230_03650 [Corynebacterium sp. 320]|uniref:Transposase n=1 Tax=Corynebacterium zhongnanshanii TaxID=2768834 RepID=A0ABQ6VFF3_9CORY|nr:MULTISPECIES: hypothetical protein [Corynebacterium]KAB1504192.1 hypothetical protein F7230_03650 [Corynebacterium sp. 320]KAB1552708.1 hypothetical protein F7233_02940 [Corynebacterium sp. 321]KAB1554074.1 hypothetical protein F7232_03645 [Corynebacterium sp. 319]KAB3522954.1 hypothetical protein F8377_01960 [Corynebacterium zhongnanshanii]KAB3528328.1 hypothetical protein F8354_03650 [Corynebacterium sp. 250]